MKRWPNQPPYRETFFRLIGFLKPYKASLIVSIVLACGSQAAQIAIVWVIGGVIDKAINPRELPSALDLRLDDPGARRRQGGADGRPAG